MWKVIEVQMTVSIRNPQPSLAGLVAYAIEHEDGRRYGTHGEEGGYPVIWGNPSGAQSKADRLNGLSIPV